MNWTLLLLQALNGVQYGLLLFLLAAGLTLVLGIMNFVNLAHASFYMLGAYFGAAMVALTGQFLLSGVAAVLGTLAVGVIIERTTLLAFYRRTHLDQVLATFGLILIFDEGVRIVWGPQSMFMRPPTGFTGTLHLFGAAYPAYRFLVIATGLVVAAGLYIVIHHTRAGMLIRAGATDAAMVGALGVDVRRLTTGVFGIGAALAGLSGFMAGPILAVQSGMGDDVLIIILVVIVVGGIGSIRGAFAGALLVGIVDTLGRTYLPLLLRQTMDRNFAAAAGPAMASMLIYILMAVILAFRPQGLLPARR
jgi:branched-chain amino acid transport system permease protein